MPNVVYDNKVISTTVADFMDTALNHSPFFTVDTTLAQAEGMTKTINKYTATGNVRDVAQGEGNQAGDEVQVSFTQVDYTVKFTQGVFAYYDEEAMKDSNLVPVGMEKMGANMANDLRTKFYAELDKTTRTGTYPIAGIDFNTIVDTTAMFGENEEGIFMLINPNQKAQLRKNLKDDLKYIEGFVHTGYIGNVNNVPIYTTKKVAADTAYMATNKAVTAFIKKEVETEQARTANPRKNDIYTRRCNVVALTDETKAFKLTKAVA